MSQVQLKDIKISELHLEIDRLKKVDQGAQKISHLEEKMEELKQKIGDQQSSLTGRSALLGARYLIWDVIISSMVKFRPYLDMLEDKEALYPKSLHKCVVLNETMTKRSPKISQNTTGLLNSTTSDQLQVLGL